MSDAFAAVAVGDTRSFETPELSRANFVRYAGASGDFNPIHFDESFARAAGLPGVFGQGMFTAGVLSRVVSSWFGPAAVKRYAVRFATRVWPGDTVQCRGEVTRVYEADGVRHVDLVLTASSAKGELLIHGEATVRAWEPR